MQIFSAQKNNSLQNREWRSLFRRHEARRADMRTVELRSSVACRQRGSSRPRRRAPKSTGYSRSPSASATLYELRSSRRERENGHASQFRLVTGGEREPHTRIHRRDGTPTRKGTEGAVSRRETLHTRVHIRRFLSRLGRRAKFATTVDDADGGRATASRRRVGGGHGEPRRAKISVGKLTGALQRVVRALSTAQFTG